MREGSILDAFVLSSADKKSMFILRGYRDDFVTKDMRRRKRKDARKGAKIAPQAIKGE